MFAISFPILLIRLVLFLWDVLTFPIYLLLQQPWKKSRKISRTRARITTHQATEITVRALPVCSSLKEELKAAPDQITTMANLFSYCVKKYGERAALGSRAVVGEEEEQQPDGRVFTKLQLGDYSWLSYLELSQRAEQVGRGLRDLGLLPRSRIVLYADTCAEWMICAIGSFRQSMAVVTIYTNLGEEGVRHGIGQTEAELVFVSRQLLPRLLSVLPHCPSVSKVVVLPDHRSSGPLSAPAGVSIYRLEDLVQLGCSSNHRSTLPDPADPAIIMYTSGSTGSPKGVVLTHANLVQALYCIIPTAADALGGSRPTDCYIAILPLAHVLELLAENLMLVMGIPIGYSSTKTFTDTGTAVARGSRGDATVLRPSVVCVVPLVLDSIYKGINANVKRKGEFFRQLVDLCYRYRLGWTRKGYDTPIMNFLIFSKFRAIVGGNLRVLLSGGAPLAPDCHNFCRTVLGINLLQGYGLTETAATACIPDGSDLSTGRVGGPLQEVDIRLVDWQEGGYTVTDQQGPRGEVVIGGGHVAKEYFGMPEKTEEEFFTDNGKRWFRTGDIGQMMPDGTIKLIDRKKDLVKLQLGEYVSLGKVESLLKIHPAIENICVVADSNESHTVALVVPALPYLQDLGIKIGKSTLARAELCREEEVVADCLQVLTRHGAQQKLAKFEIPRAVFLVAEPWTPESGLITAAMKLKRKSIEAAFTAEISELYDNNNNQGRSVINNGAV